MISKGPSSGGTGGFSALYTPAEVSSSDNGRSQGQFEGGRAVGTAVRVACGVIVAACVSKRVGVGVGVLVRVGSATAVTRGVSVEVAVGCGATTTNDAKRA
jgi:hypothetical protein